MSVEKVNCPNCGAPLEYEMWQGRYKCNYCQSTFRDKKDNASDGNHSSKPRPEIKLEDLEELMAPLGNIVDEFSKGFVTPLEDVVDAFGKGFSRVIKTVAIVVTIIAFTIIAFVIGIIMFS